MQLLDGSGASRFCGPLLCRPVSLCKVVLYDCRGRSKLILLGKRGMPCQALE